MRKKILFAINNLKFGGAPAVVSTQALGLNPEEFDVHVMTLHHNTSPGYVDSLAEQVPVHAFPLKNGSLLDIRTLWSIFRFLRSERFDVVYTHLFLCNFLVRGLALLARVPVLIAFEHSAYTNKRFWQVWVDRVLARWTARIIVSTPAVAEFTATQQHLSEEKFAVIVNPVVLPPVDSSQRAGLREEMGVSQEAFLVISLGRFSEEKGLTYLLQAIAKLEVPVECRLLGYGALKRELQKEINALGIAEQCALVTRAEKAKEYLQVADVFVLPSLREGQSIVTYEAMMAGVPVIASDLPALRDVVTDGETGLLVPLKNPEEIAAAILLLYTNDALRKRLAQVAGKRVLPFTPERNAAELAALIHSLI